MTTPDKLSDLHHRLDTLARKLSDCMSDLGGIARVLEGLGSGEACREGREPVGAGAEDAVDYGVYRGVVGAYAPVRLVGPTGDEANPVELPIVPDDTPEPPEADWRKRLVFDFEVSDVSPVIRGTWITVSHIVSLLVDGFSWADILGSHPELTEDDVRAAVGYAVAEDDERLVLSERRDNE